MTDTCVCCGRAVPEGRMVCPECEIESLERSVKMDDGLAVKVAEIDERCKSNTHRIDELAADNKALHELASSVSKLVVRQEVVETSVKEIQKDVKDLKNIPVKRWEAVVEKVILVLVGAVIAFILGRVGL